MRKFLFALAIASLCTACAPQASAPPSGGESATTTSSSGLSAPASPAAASPDAAAATPAALPSGHPPMGDASPGAMPSDHPPMGDASPGAMPSGMPPGHPAMSDGAAPPPGHMDSGGMNVTSTEGAVVSVQEKELILARPGGTELRFLLPEDLKVLPEGKTRADLKEGTRIKIEINTMEKGMEAKTIEIEDLPAATR